MLLSLYYVDDDDCNDMKDFTLVKIIDTPIGSEEKINQTDHRKEKIFLGIIIISIQIKSNQLILFLCLAIYLFPLSITLNDDRSHLAD